MKYEEFCPWAVKHDWIKIGEVGCADGDGAFWTRIRWLTPGGRIIVIDQYKSDEFSVRKEAKE
uniref:Methyltransferase n=1 Tax=viral metagenome TaxID=1070528 RepID=A0A6H1ZWK8_9ZZZZ